MKFIRPVDLFDIARAVELYDKLEVEVKTFDQSLFDIHQGIRSSVRKEARSIAATLLDNIDMDFVALLDSMCDSQFLSIALFNYDKDTKNKRKQLVELQTKYDKLLKGDNHRANARRLAEVLNKKTSTEKELQQYSFEAFEHYKMFVDQYGHNEPVDFWEKMKDGLSGVASKRKELKQVITQTLGQSHDPEWHLDRFETLTKKLEELHERAEEIRVDVSKISGLRVKISQLSENLAEAKDQLLTTITKQLEVEIPKMDIFLLLNQCPSSFKQPLSIYFVALTKLKLFDYIMRYTYSLGLGLNAERDVLQILENKMNNREIVDLTRVTREAMLYFVVYRPIVIHFDGMVRLKLIKDIVAAVHKVVPDEAGIENIKKSIIHLLDNHGIDYLPPEILLLLCQGYIKENDMSAIKALEVGSPDSLYNEANELAHCYDEEWLSVAKITNEQLFEFSKLGLGSKFSLVEFKNIIDQQDNIEEQNWFSRTIEASPSKVKECLGID